MNKYRGILVGSFLAVICVVAIAATPFKDLIVNGIATFDVGSILNLNGTIKIDGTELTATAASLNGAVASTLIDHGTNVNQIATSGTFSKTTNTQSVISNAAISGSTNASPVFTGNAQFAASGFVGFVGTNLVIIAPGATYTDVVQRLRL